MRISEIIAALEDAKCKHGDLPAYTFDSDIGKVEITPCTDGVEVFENGKRETPNEFVIEFHPKLYQ